MASDLHEQGVTHRMSDAADGAVNAGEEMREELREDAQLSADAVKATAQSP